MTNQPTKLKNSIKYKIIRMCKSKMSTKTTATAPSPRSPRVPTRTNSTTATTTTNSTTGYKLTSSTATTSSSAALTGDSLSRLRSSLPSPPVLYSFSEIRLATNNFLSKPSSSSHSLSSSWRCVLRNKDVVLFQRKLRRLVTQSEVKDRLGDVYRSHHVSIVKLVGVCLSPSSDYVYLGYEFVSGASLEDCLRSKRNPGFTVLSTWMSRMQVAADLADGLDYIHNNTGLGSSHVHKHIKSSGVIVTEPGFNAKICHFGAAELCGETDAAGTENGRNSGEIEGVRGYMAPELGVSGNATQKSDVYAFGVVILELLSGEEPVRYKFDKASGDYKKISVIEAAEYAVDGEGEEVSVRLRKWIDRRLKDSFPVEAVEKLVRLALECVHVAPDQRPDMRRIAHKISKLYLQSEAWCKRVRVPTEISVSLAPR